MRAFLVTGVCGAGKSTVARRLCEWGHRAVSVDGDDQLCSWTTLDGGRVTRPDQPDAAWLAVHERRWDPTRLDEIIAEAGSQDVPTVWICGRAANALQLADRFDATFLLEIDQQTMITRMGSPQRGSGFGRASDTLAAALASRAEFVAAWRRYGALAVDATGAVDTVAQDLLMAAGLAALRRPQRAD